MCAHAQTRTQIRAHTHTHARAHTHIPPPTHTQYTHTHPHTHTPTHTHTYTHENTEYFFFFNTEYAIPFYFLKNRSLALFQKNYHLLLSLRLALKSAGTFPLPIFDAFYFFLFDSKTVRDQNLVAIAGICLCSLRS